MWYKNIEIQGLIARDRTNWTEEFLEDISSSGYGIIWRDTYPTNYNEVIPQLREIINNVKTFDFYIVKNNLTVYKATIEDFATKSEYQNKKSDWDSKKPVWFRDDFGRYSSGNSRAKVVFLVKAFEKIPKENQLNINSFETFGQASIKNYVAYTKIITMTDDIVKILLQKKNLILQGAPGTGKTYITATLALKALDIKNIDWNDHYKVMSEYNKKVEEGRIAFTTFHQSMD